MYNSFVRWLVTQLTNHIGGDDLRIDERLPEPIFIQIANNLEEAILKGIYNEESQIPSTNELSALLAINPQTVLKGMNILVSDEIIYKKRGVGMFVCSGAIGKIKKKREEMFYERFVRPLINEAKSLDVSLDETVKMLEKGYTNESDNS